MSGTKRPPVMVCRDMRKLHPDDAPTLDGIALAVEAQVAAGNSAETLRDIAASIRNHFRETGR